jgi:hypothetical protein
MKSNFPSFLIPFPVPKTNQSVFQNNRNADESHNQALLLTCRMCVNDTVCK